MAKIDTKEGGFLNEEPVDLSEYMFRPGPYTEPILWELDERGELSIVAPVKQEKPCSD